MAKRRTEFRRFRANQNQHPERTTRPAERTATNTKSRLCGIEVAYPAAKLGPKAGQANRASAGQADGGRPAIACFAPCSQRFAALACPAWGPLRFEAADFVQQKLRIMFMRRFASLSNGRGCPCNSSTRQTAGAFGRSIRGTIASEFAAFPAIWLACR